LISQVLADLLYWLAMFRRRLLTGVAVLAAGSLLVLGGVVMSTVKTRQAQDFLLPVVIPTPRVENSLVEALQRAFKSYRELWKVDVSEVLQSELTPPVVRAEAALLVDISTDTVLFSKNPHQRRPVASTLKIMTATVALERGRFDQKIGISKRAAEVGEDMMGVSAGECYTLEELLYGLLLPSGNDAAEAIAEGLTGGRRELFIDWMNAKAWELGLEDTRFVNPSGLDGDGEHYSTAYDLLVMTRYALKSFPRFRKIVATTDYEIPYSPDHKYLYLQNQTNLLRTYPGVFGVKPGWTPRAGLCLVTAAARGDHTLVGVVLGSPDRRGDMELLLDYGFVVLGLASSELL